MSPSRRKPASPSVAPRAPRRTGVRTTLRVPDDLAETVERYAEQHRTSANDALVRLAYDGARFYEQAREVEQVARVRSEAIMRSFDRDVPPGTELPSDEETTDAILAWRRGLVDDDEGVDA
jgi:uncharacterized membrane protein